MKSYNVQAKENNIRLDKFIYMKVNANKTFLLMMLRKKCIKVNNVCIKDDKMTLKENDIVNIYLDDSAFKKIVDMPLKIAYEDENLIIIDKEKKMEVHSSTNFNNVLDITIKYLLDKGGYIPSLKTSFKPALVNRIDTNTKGLVVIAKEEESLKILDDLLMKREIKKTYLALVANSFKEIEATYQDYLLKDEKNNRVKIFKKPVEGSKEIITSYKVIKDNGFISMIEVNLITGRTHQIRSHLAFYDHPILGDSKYGNMSLNRRFDLDSQELIAYTITFPENNLAKLSYLANKTIRSKMQFDLDLF